MGIFSLFKKQNTSANIFIEKTEAKKLETKSGEIDYILSRSLYASIPTKEGEFYDYALGNYATKAYIDTLSSFIGVPRLIGGEQSFNVEANRFIEKNHSTLIKIYRQAMIDGLVYVWIRLEKDVKGVLQPVIKIMPRETFVKTESIKRTSGIYDKVVFESVETWKEKKNNADLFSATQKESIDDNINEEEELIEKKARIRITLTPYTEQLNIIGDLPPQYKEKKRSINTGVNFVPVFAFCNNPISFISEGLPEITNVLPFIKKYNATFKLVEKHLNQVLDPKIKLHLRSAKAFLQNNLGIRERDYDAIEKGELKPDVTQFKAAILTGDNEDVSFVTQDNNIKSAIEVLNLIHWIIVEMTMPEYLYGTALNTTNASVREQSPVWIKKIEDKRGEYSQFYSWLSDVFSFYLSILKNTLPTFDDEGISIEWEELEAQDDVALMNALQKATDSILKALDASLISPETAFNALKQFITIPEEYEAEHKKAIEYIREKNQLEAEGEQLKNTGFSDFANNDA